jgi:hypothetical protein
MISLTGLTSMALIHNKSHQVLLTSACMQKEIYELTRIHW